MHYIYVVSDGTGGTAIMSLKAALTQFEGAEIHIERYPNIRTAEEVERIVKEAAKVEGLIIYTFVSEELCKVMVEAGRLHNVEIIDLIGPLLMRLSQQLTISPIEKPGLFSQLDENYFRRIETMEFAIHHDDGLRSHELDKAEVVLVGVSRTFKTPLSIYLAFKGWFVANIPLILGTDPPAGLFELPPGRVFGLTADAERLAELRRAREEHLGKTIGNYAKLEYVKKEIQFAQDIFNRKAKWPVINVTDKPIEEIASEILAYARQKRKKDER
jgi:regulator of PEP synthase PpsR (kinase-PPPase family)